MFTKCIERSELCKVTNSSESSSTPCLLNGNLHSHAANVALVVMIKVGLFHPSLTSSLSSYHSTGFLTVCRQDGITLARSVPVL